MEIISTDFYVLAHMYWSDPHQYHLCDYILVTAAGWVPDVIQEEMQCQLKSGSGWCKN